MAPQVAKAGDQAAAWPQQRSESLQQGFWPPDMFEDIGTKDAIEGTIGHSFVAFREVMNEDLIEVLASLSRQILISLHANDAGRLTAFELASQFPGPAAEVQDAACREGIKASR